MIPTVMLIVFLLIGGAVIGIRKLVDRYNK